MTDPIKLAMADDHPPLRSGLGTLLQANGNFKLLFEADNGKEFLDSMRSARELPDICILDLKMHEMDGFETLKVLKREFPNVRVLIYSQFLEEYNVLRIYRDGAQGALSKSASLDDFMAALVQIYNDGLYIPESISTKVVEAARRYELDVPMLSPREKEYLALYLADYSYKEIAEKMEISVKTVDSYKEHISAKLNIFSKVALILFALKTGIVGWNI